MTTWIRYRSTLLMSDKSINIISCEQYHPRLPKVTQGYATYTIYSMIYKDNGNLLIFGNNYNGQLRLNNCRNITIPILLMKDMDIKIISCSNTYSIIYKNNGNLFMFGNNEHRYILSDILMINPTLLMNDSKIQFISTGVYHSMIVHLFSVIIVKDNLV